MAVIKTGGAGSRILDDQRGDGTGIDKANRGQTIAERRCAPLFGSLHFPPKQNPGLPQGGRMVEKWAFVAVRLVEKVKEEAQPSERMMRRR
jgi:hypothetical protein